LALAPERRVDLQQQRPVGCEAAGAEVVDRPHKLDAESAPGALVGERGVDEAVEQDPRPAREQRRQRLLDELCPRGGVEQRLGTSADRQRRVLDELADPLRDRDAARLAQQLRVDPTPAQVVEQRARERRLAGAVDPLDRDQPAARHRCDDTGARCRYARPMADQPAAVPGTEDHPQARMTLSAALAGAASHAYLFHGPAGVGKRTAARAFAAELLAAGEEDRAAAHHRALAGTHPDLTWVKPTGAHVMRTEDVAEPVVAAATRTPFESSKRVFVLERVDTMNDEVANRLLKTLEEPPPFVHLILLTDSLGQVLPTVVSRCQLVRFDPLPAARIAERLVGEGVEAHTAEACARLALGNAARARFLASEDGLALRADVDRLVASALAGGGRPAGESEAWRGLLDRAEERRGAAEERVAEEAKARLASEPKGRERSAIEKQFEDAAKRDGRRARTEILDLGLTLAALRFRDLLCRAEGAGAAVLDPAGASALLAPDADPPDPRRLRAAAERCENVRMSLELNVTEDLALEVLGFRLARLVTTSA
jgi:DNA polymerase III subunit delta'